MGGLKCFNAKRHKNTASSNIVCNFLDVMYSIVG